MILLFVDAMLEIVRDAPATLTDQSELTGMDGLWKEQPPLTERLMDVSFAATESSIMPLPSYTVTAADAEMSAPFCSIQRKSAPMLLFPNEVQEIAQYEIVGTVKVVVVIGVVSRRLV